MTNLQLEQYKLKKANMMCLGLKPRAAGWKALKNPLVIFFQNFKKSLKLSYLNNLTISLGRFFLLKIVT